MSDSFNATILAGKCVGPAKRYLVFCPTEYYPDGGMKDCVGMCDTLEEVREKFGKVLKIESRAHVFDLVEGCMIEEGLDEPTY